MNYFAKITPQRSIYSQNRPCPCTSGKILADCCQLVIDNHNLAKTPEILMRSRYTAFVIENSAYIQRTWDPATLPGELTFAEKIRWLNLEIIDSAVSTDGEEGWVDFETSMVTQHDLVKTQEKSHFIRKNKLWLYHNGDLQTIRYKLSLNGSCPCGSGKKFKRCCRPRS